MLWRAGIIVLLLILSTHSAAHRVHFGWTNIQQGNQSIEIVHRFHEHDASQWLMKNLGQTADVTQIETQARFALYVAEAFSIANGEETLIPDTIGAELRGRYLFVYQELPSTSLRNSITVDSEILMDLHADQIHMVDVQLGRLSGTLEFHATSDPQEIEFIAAQTTARKTAAKDNPEE